MSMQAVMTMRVTTILRRLVMPTPDILAGRGDFILYSGLGIGQRRRGGFLTSQAETPERSFSG
jgi:hypothetical protein